MKILFYIVLVLLVINISCNTSSPKKKLSSNDSIVNNIRQENKNDLAKNIKIDNQKTQKIDQSLLQGIWAESKNQNANFRIKGDSMYFIEDGPCHINISNDTLVTFYGDDFNTYDKIVKLSNDSLVLLNEFGKYIKLIRIK